MTITVRYSSIDGFSKRATFKTLAGARKFAQKWVGETPELGSTYAVSFDGVGKITGEGASLRDLFPALAEPVSATWFAVTQEGFQVGGPYTTADQARAQAFAMFLEGRGSFAVEEWIGDDFIRYHSPVAVLAGPELPDGLFGVNHVTPIYHPVYDGVVGSEHQLIGVFQTRDAAEAECTRIAAKSDPDSETYHELVERRAGQWRQVGFSRIAVDDAFDDMPF